MRRICAYRGRGPFFRKARKKPPAATTSKSGDRFGGRQVTKDTHTIEASNLAKRFGDVVAVDSVTFDVRPGELFGFLGPNGAGKTTTINMLTGLARADTGSIRIGGIDCTDRPRAAQHLIGVGPDGSNPYPELTGFENLCFCAALYGLRKSERRRRAQQLLESFGVA